MAAEAPLPPVTHRRVWKVAGPIIVSNSTVPLIGLADTAVIGHLGEAGFIAAIALGAIVFNALYWVFGFLRMGTTGLAAQALGARDEGEMRSAFHRALMLGGGLGILLIVAQVPLAVAVFWAFDASAGVEALTRDYFAIRIWGAPAMLANFVVLGWFIGIQRSDVALYLQLYLNIANVLLDVLFVVGLGFDVAGVAYGTVLAEWSAAAAGVVCFVFFARRRTGAAFAAGDRLRLLDATALRRMLNVNGDIFVRSAFLMAAFLWLTARGAEQGDVTLAANGVLLHFFYLAAYALDGFAFAGEALVGESIGARNRRRFREAVVISSVWAVASAVLFAVAFALGGSTLIAMLTSVPEVRAAANLHLAWAVAFPVIAVASFQLDGIFIGATRTADMRNMMALSFAVYILAWWVLTPYGNHGLWAAFVIFNLARGITLGARYPGLSRSIEVSAPERSAPANVR